MEARKWHIELNEAREGDLPQRLEPVGYCRGATAEKVRLPSANNATTGAKLSAEHSGHRRRKARSVLTVGSVCVAASASRSCTARWPRRRPIPRSSRRR